jgi:hypothetical protein
MDRGFLGPRQFVLFSIGKRYSLLRFLELLWSQRGGPWERTSFTAACEASRQSWTTRRCGSIDVTEGGPAQLPELMARHRRR